MAKTKAATAEHEAKAPEQEQTTPETEETASPAEGETQEQRGEETPDPLAGATFQQLQEHPHFKEDWESLTAAQKEEREKAYRDGQSAGAKQADEKTREYVAAQEAIKVFDDLEQKRLSQDPDDLQEYANAMGDPKKEEAYKRGRSAKQGPGAEEIATRAIHEAMTEVYQPLKQHLLLKDMTEEEHKAIRGEFAGKPQPLTALIKRYHELIIERGTAAGRKDEDAKQLKDAKDEGRREAYDEMGLKYPADEIEGGKPAKRSTVDELRKKYADGDIETEEYTKRMEAIGAKP